MSKIIDITSKITNELPMVKITDELVLTVNNRKNTIISMQAMINEVEKKAQNGEFNELSLMNTCMEMLVGKKASDEIDKMNLPFPEYKIVYQAVMAAATNSSLEDVNQRFQ